MDEKKMTKIMVVGAVVIALATGGFAYHTHQVSAKETAEKKAFIAGIDKQKEQEAVAQQAKANDPKVDESHPARYATPADQAPATGTPQSPGTSSTQANSALKTETPATSQKIPTQTPATTTTPPAQPTPKITPDPVPAITSLSDADIQRLQSYQAYGTQGQGFYESFNDFYANDRSNAEGFSKTFTPATLSAYDKAKVGWLTSPRLVYSSVTGQFCIRGILTLTYYGDNSFGLTPNVTYQREVEYRLDNSVKNGKVSLSLDSTHYLSGFQAVK